MSTKRKYTVVAKVGQLKFVKYRTNHPKQLIEFLNKKFGSCLFANFYFKHGEKKGQLAGTYGKIKGFDFI